MASKPRFNIESAIWSCLLASSAASSITLFAPTRLAILLLAVSIAACPGSALIGLAMPRMVPAFGTCTLRTVRLVDLVEPGMEIFTVRVAAVGPFDATGKAAAAAARPAAATAPIRSTAMRLRRMLIGSPFSSVH